MAVEKLQGWVGNWLERVNLPVEGVLWETILEEQGVAEMLGKGDCQVLLIGTDDRLNLARKILDTYAGTKITVVEADEGVAEAAKRNVPEEMKGSITIVDGAFPDIELPDQRFRIVIAKHLLHFYLFSRRSREQMVKIIDAAKAVLESDGLFFASVLPGATWPVGRVIGDAGIASEERPLGWWQGTLFIFKN